MEPEIILVELRTLGLLSPTSQCRIQLVYQLRGASSLVRGAECREIKLRIRRREKNVLDIPLYRTGLITSLRFYFAFFGVDERYGDFSTTCRPNNPTVSRQLLDTPAM